MSRGLENSRHLGFQARTKRPPRSGHVSEIVHHLEEASLRKRISGRLLAKKLKVVNNITTIILTFSRSKTSGR